MKKNRFQKQTQLFLKADLIVGSIFIINMLIQQFPSLYKHLQTVHLYQRFLALNVVFVLASFSILTFLVPLAAYEAKVLGQRISIMYFLLAIMRFVMWLELLIRFSQRLGLAFSPLRNILIFISILILEAIIIYHNKKTAQ